MNPPPSVSLPIFLIHEEPRLCETSMAQRGQRRKRGSGAILSFPRLRDCVPHESFRTFEPPRVGAGGGPGKGRAKYPFAIDSDSWRSVRGGNVGVIQFTDRCFDLLGRWFESSEVTGQSFPLKDRDVKTLGISLQRFPIVSGVPQPVIAHFRAQKSDADEWIVKKD